MFRLRNWICTGGLVSALVFVPVLVAAAQGGSTVTMRLNDTLSSGSAQPGDSFTGTLAAPLVVGDRIVAGEGTPVIGQVTEAVSSGRLKRPALLTLRLRSTNVGHGGVPMQTGDLTVKAGSHGPRDVLIIGGSAAAGSAIGAAVGGGKGAAIGAGAGAGAGVLGAYLSGKQEIVLPSETLLTFHVNSVTISPKELASLQRVSHPAEYEPRLQEPDHQVYRRHHRDDDDDDQGEDRDDDRFASRRDGGYSFGEGDREILRGCLSGYDFESLPPGIQKKLARGGTLPPGQAKKLRSLPDSCTVHLPRCPRDVERIIFGDRVILIEGGSRILDMLIFER